MLNNLVPEGFKDDVSELVAIEHKYKNFIINYFQLHGYKLIKTPLIEYKHIDKGKNSFQIQVNKKEKKLIIRDDITLQVIRLSSARFFQKPRPLKLCYYGEVVRKKGSMLRPERQFLQIGAECIGESSNYADVEMMELAFSALNIVGIKKITIEIGSRIFLDKLYKSLYISKNLSKIKKLIKQKDLYGALKFIDKKYHKYLKDIFLCTGNFFDKKKQLENLKIDENNALEVNNIKEIVKNFSLNNKKAKIFLDLSEVDDKNYHNGIRFTMFAENIRGEIARGGRYIVKNSKNIEKATGFTCFMDSIMRASSSKERIKKIMIPFNTNSNRKKKLFKDGYIIVTHFDDLSNTKIRAKEQNCQFYLEDNDIKFINI